MSPRDTDQEEFGVGEPARQGFASGTDEENQHQPAEYCRQ